MSTEITTLNTEPAGYTRRQELRCTEADLTTYANTILFAGEVLYVKLNSGRYGQIIGDGVTPLSGLHFVINYDDVNAIKEKADNTLTLATAQADRAKEEADRAEQATANLSSLSVADGLLNITYEEVI